MTCQRIRMMGVSHESFEIPQSADRVRRWRGHPHAMPRRRRPAGRTVEQRKAVLQSWRFFASWILRAVQVGHWMIRQARVLHFLAARFPVMEKAVLALETPTARTTPSESSKSADSFPKNANTCRHKSCAECEDPIKHYSHKGAQYETCKLCGSRWQRIYGHSIPLPPYPRPDAAPRQTAKKYLGEVALWFGAHKGIKMAGLPEHYLQWALKQHNPGKDLSYVVAYAIVAGT